MACDLSVFPPYLLCAVIIFLVAALRLDGRLLSGRLAKFALSPGHLASAFHRVILLFALSDLVTCFFIQGRLQAAGSSPDLGAGGCLPSGHRLLRHPVVRGSLSLLWRDVRVL